MDITHLSIRNCLTIGHAELELDNRGLLLVQGENTDDTSAKSNGAGKSSILDALCWVLYGTTARDVTGDDVVNDTAKKDCSVIAVLNDDGVRYKIERFRKHAKYKNQLFVWQLNDDPMVASIDLAKGTDKETQEVVNRIMGCSLDVFVGAIYAGQEKMPDLPGMTDKHLKLIVEEAAGVEELALCYTEARTRALKAESEYREAASKSNEAESQLNDAKDILTQRETESAEFEAGRKQRAKDELVKAAPALKAAEATAALADSIDGAVLTARKTILETQLAAHKSQETERDRLRAVVQTADRKVTSGRTNIDTEKRRIDKQKVELANIESQVGNPCGECGKPYCEHDLAAAKAARKAAIDAAIANLRANVESFRLLQTELATATEAMDKFVATMTDVTMDSVELSGINNDLAILAGYRSQIESGKREAEAFKVTAKSKLTEPNPHTKAIEDGKKRIEALEAAVVTRQADSLVRADAAELCADAVKVFGPAGVRAHILDTVTPYLNEKTSEYLGALADGNIRAVWSTLTKTAKGDMKEKFNIEVTNDKGGKTFKALSGGEKRKVRIATAMALQDMVASRASKPIGLFMADEIDHALDEPGLERLMTVLDRKAKERGTVIVVSHNSLSDWIDNVIHVKKESGVSTVTGATHRGF